MSIKKDMFKRYLLFLSKLDTIVIKSLNHLAGEQQDVIVIVYE